MVKRIKINKNTKFGKLTFLRELPQKGLLWLGRRKIPTFRRPKKPTLKSSFLRSENGFYAQIVLEDLTR